jgi:hypothetical protein
MRKLIGFVAALASAPLVGVAALSASAPAFADTPGVSPTCFPQSVNPHPTDPAGSTTATLFCTTPTPSANANGSGSTGTGSGAGKSGGSHGAGTTGAGTAAGGSQTTLANSTGSGAPDESSHVKSGSSPARSLTGNSSGSFGSGMFGGLVGFFSATGGLLFLFGLLVLMAIVLIAIGVVSWLRRGQVAGWASHARSLSFRPKS